MSEPVIDKNMIPKRIDREDVTWYDVREEPMTLYGIDHTDGRFARLPENFPLASLRSFANQSAGGRVRFRTDSSFLTLRAALGTAQNATIFSDNVQLGFDVYRKTEDGREVFAGTFRPPMDSRGVGYEGILGVGGTGMREYTVNFPCFTEVKELWIGVQNGSTVEKDGGYRFDSRPVVFYGSSITHGAGASRSGMTYESMICQRLFLNHRNFGFSGMAKGEPEMAEYIASLDMCAFVLDLDHNVYDPAQFRKVYAPFYRIIREAQPELPILMVSAPITGTLPKPFAEKREIIMETFAAAQAAGDRHVAFADGNHLFDGPFAQSCTADGCHPNDLGFYRMAQGIGGKLAELLGLDF